MIRHLLAGVIVFTATAAFADEDIQKDPDETLQAVIIEDTGGSEGDAILVPALALLMLATATN